MEGGQIVA